MGEMANILHYCSIALVVGANAISVGIGEGLVGYAAIDATSNQPEANNEVSRLAILGMALTETAAIIGVSMALILIMGTMPENQNLYSGPSEIGIALAISLSGLAIGLVSAWPAVGACYSIARQPFSGNKILRFMLITQSMIQTPIIFSFIIAMLIRNQISTIDTVAESLRMIASGLCVGLGSIGPSIGLAKFGKTACMSIGINKKSYNQLFSFTLISAAIIETPIIFALVVGLFLISSPASTILQSIAMIGAALCIGLGTIGPGIASGKSASRACIQIAKNPTIYSYLSKVSMFAQGMIDTAAIYAFIISLSLILFR